MKIRLLVTTVMMMGGLMFVHAQGEAEYRLREVGAEEYLNAIPSILEQFANETQNNQNRYEYGVMLQSVTRELAMKYPDLSTVSYKALKLADSYIEYSGRQILEQEWQNWKILAALRESGSDISTLSELRVEDYTIHIKRIDFNADYIDELLLDIQSEVGGYHEFWVLTPNETTTFGYQRIDTPDLWFSTNCDFRSVCGGDAKTLEVRDVNADGLPEWAIAVGSYCGYGECGGRLLVLGWRNTKIVSLTKKSEFWDLVWTDGSSKSVLPPNGGWSFKNTDDDFALELVQTLNIEDNRSCVIRDVRIFDWSQANDAYIRARLTRDYDNSTGCALRLGHEAMKAGNYSKAIKAYKNALQFFAATTDLNDYNQEAQQYSQIRLMIAYALANQSENALQVREELEKQTPQSDAMGYFIDALNLYSNKNDKIALCYAVNEAVWKYDPYASSSKFYAFGSTDDVKGRPLTYVGAEFSGESSGCPITVLLQQLALDLSLAHNQSPVSGLNKQGWEVTASVNGDMNNDSVIDWLVWTKQTSASPVLFMSSSEMYDIHILYNLSPSPEKETEMAVRQLSDKSGSILVRTHSELTDEYDDCPNTDKIRYLSIWYWKSGEFKSMDAYPLCEPKTLDDIFPQPGVLQAWSYSSVASNILVPTTFLWNTQSQSFEVKVQATPDPLPVISTTTETNVVTEPCYQNPYKHCGFSGSGEELLAQLDTTIATPPANEYPYFLTVAHYYRALTLEALNRPDEALAEYVAIYTAASESAWGRLAALHIECVAHC